MWTNGWVALAVSLALTACGDRSNPTAAEGPSGEPAVQAGSQPSPTDSRSPALKLRLATAGDIASWAGDRNHRSRLESSVSMGRVYVVLDDVTLPSGLFGAHRRDFIVPSGVPKPKGPKGHCTFYYLKDHTFE